MTSTAITNKKTMPKAIVLGFGFNSLTAGQYGDSFNKAVTCWCSSQLTNLQRKICVVLSQCAKFSLGNRLQNICFFLKSNSPQRRGWPLGSPSSPKGASFPSQGSFSTFPCFPTGVLGRKKKKAWEAEKGNLTGTGGERQGTIRVSIMMITADKVGPRKLISNFKIKRHLGTDVAKGFFTELQIKWSLGTSFHPQGKQLSPELSAHLA